MAAARARSASTPSPPTTGRGATGVWQRPRRARGGCAAAPLLVPMGVAARATAVADAPAVVVPPPVDAVGRRRDGPRDIAAITYARDPVKKGLDRVLAAWARARREGEELVVRRPSTTSAREGVRGAAGARPRTFRALLRRARVYVVAPRREDYGIAQLEALADGCMLVTTAAPGPYAALPLARALDPRLVGDDLAVALRTALDDPAPGYAARAAELLAPFSPEAVDARSPRSCCRGCSATSSRRTLRPRHLARVALVRDELAGRQTSSGTTPAQTSSA